MKKKSHWVAEVIQKIPQKITEEDLAALLLTVTHAYMDGKGKDQTGEIIRFLFSLVVHYCLGAGLSTTKTKLIFVEAAAMMVRAGMDKETAEPTAPMQ